jgi:hypothetical protein
MRIVLLQKQLRMFYIAFMKTLEDNVMKCINMYSDLWRMFMDLNVMMDAF